MNPPFAYAKPGKFHYQTFDRKSLQYTNVPLYDPPKPPPFARQDTGDDEKSDEKPEGKSDGKPEGKAHDDQPSVNEGNQEADPGQLTPSRHFSRNANTLEYPVPQATAEEKPGDSTSDPVGAEKDGAPSGDAAANADEASKGSAEVTEDTEPPPAANADEASKESPEVTEDVKPPPAANADEASTESPEAIANTEAPPAANADEASTESPEATANTEAPPAEDGTTPESKESAPETTEGNAVTEKPSTEVGKEPKEAEFPPIDPAAGSDAHAAEGGGTGDMVSR
jgi:hypothetical protein